MDGYRLVGLHVCERSQKLLLENSGSLHHGSLKASKAPHRALSANSTSQRGPKPFLQTLHPKRGAKSREPEAPSFFEVFSHRQARFYCQNIIIITIVLVAVAIITIVVAAIVICCY